MKILRLIPNTLTLGNAFCGVLGIIFAMNGTLQYASLCIFIAAILDFSDGFTARLLHAQSTLGPQLDSLADAITFGALPSILYYKLLQMAYSKGVEALDVELIYLLPAIAIALSAIFRLAVFNIDTRQKDSFIGVPTPAMALFVAALPFCRDIAWFNISVICTNVWFLYVCIAVFAYLMVSPLNMLALKFHDYNFITTNVWRYLLIIIGIISIGFLKFAAPAVIIPIYILMSVIQHLSTPKQKV